MDLEAVFARAFASHQGGNLAEAERLYRQILGVAPADFGAQLLLGILRVGEGRNREALALIDGALRVNPQSDLALHNRGNVLAALNRPDEALTSYDRAIAANPASVDAYNNRGVLLWKWGCLNPALADLDAALRLNSGHAEALSNRGHVLRDMGRADEALASYRQALVLRPDHAETLHSRGNLLLAQQRFTEALADYDAVLRLNPRNADAWNDRGNALQKLERLDDAVASYDKALEIAPDYLEALNNRGQAERDRMRLDAAMADSDRVIALDPANAQAHWSKGIVTMLRGDLPEGLALYEWRKKLLRPIEARAYVQPPWTGAAEIAGKRLFVYTEQGLGDTLHFYRYARAARALGAEVSLAVQDSLVALLRDAGCDMEILAAAGVPADFDFHVPLMSLPLAFGVTLHNIPKATPYLRAQPARTEKWAARIGSTGFRIGVCWQGAPTIAGRGFAPDCLAGIARLQGVRLISLHKPSSALALPHGLHIESLGDDFDAGADGFLDAAAAMQTLDLIITADTSVAHLAGALGRPVWTALKYVPDWRWFLGRADTPWYPTMRLFRQEAPGDWTAPFVQMTSRLASLTS